MKLKIISDGNTKLKKDGIVSLNLPPVITCPGAGDCKKYCFACVGMQAMGNAKQKRINTLELFKRSPKEFVNTAVSEIKRTKALTVRFHDSGDIFSLQYLKTLCEICNKLPDVKFYAYTKSIKIILKFGWDNLPSNFKIIQSYGGKDDNLIDRNKPFALVLGIGEGTPKGFINANESDLPSSTYAEKIALTVHGGRKNKFKT